MARPNEMKACVICDKAFWPTTYNNNLCSPECRKKQTAKRRLKEPHKMWVRAWQKKNHENLRQKARDYYHKNREKVLAAVRVQRVKHRKKMLEYAKAYREKNREKLRARTSDYRKKNPEKIKQHNLTYKARKKEFQLRCDINAIGSVINPPTKG